MSEISINDYEIDEQDESKESFRIVDDSGAVWAMRKLSEVNTTIETNKKIAESERDRIDSWLEKVNAKRALSANYFIGILEDYGRRQRAEEGRKSIKLPHGVVTSRISSAKIKVEDVELFLKWAETNSLEDLIRVKKEPAVSNFKTVLEISGDKVIHTPTGEIVEGVIVTPESINFSVEPE